MVFSRDGHPGFKKLSPRRITSSPVAHADVALICELDEQWSFVGSKALQRWLWYAYNTGGVLAYTFGPRTDETCRELLALLTSFNIGMITTDNWGNYAREVPKQKHLTGKIFTQRIERNNRRLRTRIKRLARKTICFSRSVEIHEKVIFDRLMLTEPLSSMTPWLPLAMDGAGITQLALRRQGETVYRLALPPGSGPGDPLSGTQRQRELPLPRHPDYRLVIFYTDTLASDLHSLRATAPVSVALGLIIVFFFLALRWLRRQIQRQESLETRARRII